jgi:hypothetical protein
MLHNFLPGRLNSYPIILGDWEWIVSRKPDMSTERDISLWNAVQFAFAHFVVQSSDYRAIVLPSHALDCDIPVLDMIGSD